MLSSGFSEGSAEPTAGGGPMLSLDTELDDDDAVSVLALVSIPLVENKFVNVH
jgi:hypothetical protein